MTRLLFIVNTSAFFLSHRLAIAKAAHAAGFEVHVATGCGTPITDPTLTYHHVSLSRSGANVLRELKSFWQLLRLVLQIKPNILHLVTIKPIIFGGIIASLTRTQGVVYAISGLGSVFISSNRYIKTIVIAMYRIALRHPNKCIIVQNRFDKAFLLKNRIASPHSIVLIPGSGIDLDIYKFQPERNSIPVVTFASRLLKEKGLIEFIEAASIVLKRVDSIQFWIAGEPDKGNPSSIEFDEIRKLIKNKEVKIIGYKPDIRETFYKSSVIVLPSYREGLPKTLIEAAACGRSIVTTDVPGCRDAVIPNKTALLVPSHSITDLADAIEKLIKDHELRKVMGIAGRQLAEKKFDISTVTLAHLQIYKKVLAECEFS